MRGLWCLLLLACDDGGSPQPAQLADVGAIDAQVLDATRDARIEDAQEIDATEPDLAVELPDAAEPDATLPDQALPDAGPPACDELALPLGTWRNPFDSPETASAGDPHHSAIEPTVNPGSAFRFEGKFAYGTFSEDLEGENVEIWLRPRLPDCGAWSLFATGRTDGDGRLVVEHPGFPTEGHWEFRLRVPGDDSRAPGRVRVVPRGRQAVLFDVDGTLTTDDAELFEEILLGNDPDMYPGGPDVVNRWYDQGYLVMYMTGRPYFLNPSTRAWLERHGFPEGPIRTTDSLGDTLPTEDGVQTYKRNWINHLRESAGLDFVTAYGNASTDICAYAQAGISPDVTWIIGPHAGEACEGFAPTHPIADYPSHLPTLADLPRAAR